MTGYWGSLFTRLEGLKERNLLREDFFYECFLPKTSDKRTSNCFKLTVDMSQQMYIIDDIVVKPSRKKIDRIFEYPFYCSYGEVKKMKCGRCGNYGHNKRM